MAKDMNMVGGPSLVGGPGPGPRPKSGAELCPTQMATEPKIMSLRAAH